MAQEITPKEYFDHLVAYQTKALEMTAAYNQVIILAGYAAFFGVWSAIAGQVPHWVTILSGSVMLLSVTVYIAWTVVNMVFLSRHQQQMVQAMTAGLDGWFERVARAEQKSLKKKQSLMRFWLPVVSISGSSAFVATTLVAVAGFQTVSKLPMACGL